MIFGHPDRYQQCLETHKRRWINGLHRTKTKIDLTEQTELEILGEILEAYIDTPIEKDAFLIGDLGSIPS